MIIVLYKGRFGLLGASLGHSLSPHIYRHFAMQQDKLPDYQLLSVPASSDVPEALACFQKAGGLGLNVTVPYKELAYQIADGKTARAQKAGAANVLSWQPEGGWLADNTDGEGFLAFLEVPKEKPVRVLLVGAGGAAKGLLAAMQLAGGFEVKLYNRTHAKAQLLAQDFSGTANQKLEPPYHWIINASSSSLAGELPDIPLECLEGAELGCDLMYHPSGKTCFTEWLAKNKIPKVCDGYGMLVWQAALSFEIWHGILPDIKALLRSRSLL